MNRCKTRYLANKHSNLALLVIIVMLTSSISHVCRDFQKIETNCPKLDGGKKCFLFQYGAVGFVLLFLLDRIIGNGKNRCPMLG